MIMHCYCPYDVIRINDNLFEVCGDYIGGLRQQSVVSLRQLDGRSLPGPNYSESEPYLVPTTMLDEILTAGLGVQLRPLAKTEV